MALDKSKLKNDISSIMTEMLKREENSVEEFASRLANAIDAYVKDAEIVYIAGLTASSFPVVGTFEGSLK